ncbi:SulP family inorganic anion transporter [Mucisphaera calidilacus]|uniref:Putative sulfate transporter n=1 Tax=Mucisphaera calidilacus TaxID=2527982 RepID=A0A518C0I8_9BACT|nr:SulP family inorganic anion transporter [Mucisphaera calidilacus]QDU72738.1 putative sulfate transporter [Mucisphaera calidilacus]
MTSQLLKLLAPATQAFRDTNPGTLRADALAGLTVAVVAVPQSMAYAAIAGVPLQYGLYTVIFQAALGGLFASQKHLSVGPINTQSLLVASTVTLAMRQLGDVPAEQIPALYLQLVFALTILKGCCQLLMATLSLGALARYVSSAVVVGFTAGAAILIAAGQIGNFLGVAASARSSADWPGIVGVFQRLLPNITDVSTGSVVLGLLALGIVLGARMISRFVPGPLLAIVATASAVALLGYTHEQVRLVAPIPAGLDQFRFVIPWEGLQHTQVLLGGALALSLLGLMEAYSIGKSLAEKSGDQVRANQELFGQGLTNLVTGFLQCIPGSGSFSRSALNQYAGAKTAISSLFNALFVLIILLIGADYARYIPLSCLAAILFVIVYGLIDWRTILKLCRSSRADAAVCLGTLLFTLLLPLSYAVLIGVFLNLALYVRRTSQLHINEMVTPDAATGHFIERPLREHTTDQHVIFLQVEGDLFFGHADELHDRLTGIEKNQPGAIVFRLKRTRSMDSTVLAVFERYVERVRERGGHVVLCGVRPEMMKLFQSYGLAQRIGQDNIFEAGDGIFASAKRAIRRASLLTAGRGDVEAGRAKVWAYEI